MSREARALYGLGKSQIQKIANRLIACKADGACAGLTVNGRRPTLTNDHAYDPVVAVADGTLDAVDQIAARLARATKPW
jgi:hypothetical protein